MSSNAFAPSLRNALDNCSVLPWSSKASEALICPTDRYSRVNSTRRPTRSKAFL